MLRAHNTTRVSINPQTMEDNVLAAIGRRHTAEDIRRANKMMYAESLLALLLGLAIRGVIL